MDRSAMEMDTGAWRMQVWLAFALALGMTTLGVWAMPVDPWIKGYLGIGLYFTVSAAFTLAKTLRDQHEGEKIVHKLSEAKAERMLREYGEES